MPLRLIRIRCTRCHWNQLQRSISLLPPLSARILFPLVALRGRTWRSLVSTPTLRQSRPRSSPTEPYPFAGPTVKLKVLRWSWLLSRTTRTMLMPSVFGGEAGCLVISVVRTRWGCQVFCVRDRSVIRSAGWSDRKPVEELHGESVQCLVPALGAGSGLTAAGGFDVPDAQIDELDRCLVGGK